MNKQDNQASIPAFYRSWILKKYGLFTMLALDKIGAKHDTEIARCGWSIANYNMRVRMKAHSLPLWPVRIPISISIALYRRLPQIIKNLYWK